MDVHRYNQSDQRNRTDDADNSLRRYDRTEKPYLESLGLSHVGSPVSHSIAEPDVEGIGSTLDAGDKSGRRSIKNARAIRSLDEVGGHARFWEKTADDCGTRSLWPQAADIAEKSVRDFEDVSCDKQI